MEKIIWAFWFGPEMSQNRLKSLKSLENSGLKLNFVGNHNLNEFFSESDLHQCFNLLTPVHKSDYLRCVAMHKYGGAYCDIKYLSSSWLSCFDELMQSEAMALGYKEIGPGGVANIYHNSILIGDSFLKKTQKYFLWRKIKKEYLHLIGACAFIFKPNTILTSKWKEELNKRLDFVAEDLHRFPAINPRDFKGCLENPKYPIPWTYLLGDIIHPLVFKYKKNVQQGLPPPEFNDYF